MLEKQLTLDGLGRPEFERRPGPSGAPSCASCGKPLAGWITWDAIEPGSGEIIEVCPVCAHDFDRKRQRSSKR